MAHLIGIVTNSDDCFTTLQGVLERRGWLAKRLDHITRDALQCEAILWEIEGGSPGPDTRLKTLLPALNGTPVMGFSQGPISDHVLVICLERGMHDFIELAPRRINVLAARIQAALKTKRIIAPATAREGRVMILNQRDPITGLYSREQFLKNFEGMVEGCTNAGQHLSVAVLHFKDAAMIESEYGIQGANTFLRLTARSLLSVARQSDALGRVGNDRFAIALPKCTSTVALGAIDRLSRSLANTKYPFSFGDSRTPQIHVGLAGTDRGLRAPELLDMATDMVFKTLEPEQPTILVHTGTTEGAGFAIHG